MLDRNAEAVVYLQQALRLNPDSAPTHNNLGVALQRLGKFEAAQKHFARARHIDPTYATAVKNNIDNQENLK
jgi:Flp pilus assembly protein TadD